MLRTLESLRLDFSPDAAARKLEALRALARAKLATPRDVLRLHEAAAFIRAYPDDRQVLEAARDVLEGFERRADLRRLAPSLEDSGIAGTAIRYRFFASTARWLARRFPGHLTLDWSEGEFDERLSAAWPVLLPEAQAEAIRRAAIGPREAIERLRQATETDAEFYLRHVEALPGGPRVREATHDAIDAAYVLSPGTGTPSRTKAELRGAPVVFRTSAPPHGRPDLSRAIAKPPRRVRTASPHESRRLVDLAREAMVTRARDLDAFAHGDPRDVRIVDDGDGLAFALIGVAPAFRLFLPAVYGALTLRNGVPIGYVQIDVLFGNAEMSYNTFPTFRSAEAGFVFGRLLSAVHHVFGTAAFSVEPYQLGHGNDEGLDSGAWWFYALAGFRPRDPAVARLAARELARRRARPGYRSSRATLARLATAHLHWPPRARSGVVVTPIDRIGFATAAASASAARLGLGSLRGWSASERDWLRRWAPLIAALPGLERWPARDRRALLEIVRAKAGRRETDYVKKFHAHRSLARAILDL
ncbi:MAG TPA: hypothetical protein VFV19_08595 [Candidatus Polarisedimenticolaceae bacterium]|nr:hypothetical protein [Candidatus Polarisedimenticolaceae bacterium]